MRADALARRHAIVRAARHVVAQRGADVALDVIADEAGVGIATLYRNFPSRAALLDEVLVVVLEDVRRVTTEALEAFDRDPAATWEHCVRSLSALDMGAVSAASAEHVAVELSATVRAAQDETALRVRELLDAARRTGQVRQDLTVIEFLVGLATLTRPLPEAIRRAAPDLTDRLVTFFLAGMRPEG